MFLAISLVERLALLQLASHHHIESGSSGPHVLFAIIEPTEIQQLNISKIALTLDTSVQEVGTEQAPDVSAGSGWKCLEGDRE